jgi:hypothetical protein
MFKMHTAQLELSSDDKVPGINVNVKWQRPA